MPSVDKPYQSSTTDEAADWYARLRAQDATEIDGLRFRAWLSGPPERRREFEALERVWRGAGNLEQSPAMQRTRQVIMARRRQVARSRVRRRWAIAATVLLAIALGSWHFQKQHSNVIATDVGELRTVPLSDGSIVTLNTATKIRLSYSDAERGIELLTGQANFEVAKDPARAFVVKAGDREVRALGTIFDVYKATDKVTVTLFEGKVTVSPTSVQSRERSVARTLASDGEIETLVLHPSEQVSYVSTSVIETPEPIAISAADLPRVTAWRARKLSFRDTLLTDAIAEANRYSRKKIVLDAPGMETARLSGSFDAGKNDLFAEGLQAFFRLRIEHRGDDRIILTQSPE